MTALLSDLRRHGGRRGGAGGAMAAPLRLVDPFGRAIAYSGCR